MLDVSLSDPTPPSSRAIDSCANAGCIGFICPLPLTGLIMSSKCSCQESALKLIQGIFYEFQLYAIQHIMGNWIVEGTKEGKSLGYSQVVDPSGIDHSCG